MTVLVPVAIVVACLILFGTILYEVLTLDKQNISLSFYYSLINYKNKSTQKPECFCFIKNSFNQSLKN